MIILATNVDKTLLQKTSRWWEYSALKFSQEAVHPKVFFMGDTFSEDGIPSVCIPKNKLRYSSNPNLSNRSEFCCLEGGEFLDFTDFKDNDILILTDWDVVQQRKFSEKELDFLHSLGKYDIAMTQDSTPPIPLQGYLGLSREDIPNGAEVYNTGVQVGRISAWKKVYREWKDLLPEFCEQISHHAYGQALFNFIVHKYKMLKPLPTHFHDACWFNGTKSVYVNGVLTVENEVVLFNHHKFIYNLSNIYQKSQ